MLLLVRFLIRGYQLCVSPVLSFLGGPGSGCRFQPTCSVYFLEALERHGFFRGTWLGMRRLCRCHPWGGQGHDPVPEQSGRGLSAPIVATQRRLPHSNRFVCE
jgi:putative membrane protein insertion efficiency factor